MYSETKRRAIHVCWPYKKFLGIRIPFTARCTTFTKVCDYYEFMENMNHLRPLLPEDAVMTVLTDEEIANLPV